jgi:multiple sugar transport system substrate-binding protein
MSRKWLALFVIAALLVPLGVRALAQDTVTLQFWNTYNETSPENKMLTETLIPAFEKEHPNIKVESVPYPYDQFRQTLLTSLAGGQGPDIARLDIIWSPEFAQEGVLVPLDTAMPDFADLSKAVFPGPLSTNFYNGHYYGLPLDTNTRVWLYDKDLYDKAGISVPKTIDDLRAACDKVKALGDDTFAFSDGGTYGWAVLPWIWSFGGDITDANYTKSTGYLNSEKTVAAYKFLKEMIDKKCFTDGMTGSGVDSGQLYFTGKVAAILDGPWMYPIAEAQYPDFKLSSAMMPAGDGGSISVVGGENIVAFNTSKHQAEALEFIRFTQSDEYQQKMSETGQLTVKPALLETDYFKNHPYFGTFLEQLKTAKARTPVPQWNKIENDILTPVGQSILRGEVDPQTALDDAAKQIDALLAENAAQATAEATAGS